MVILYNNLINFVGHLITNNILSVLIWLPITFGALGMLFNNKYIRTMIVGFNAVNFFVSLLLLQNFNLKTSGWQFTESFPIIKDLGIFYSLGADELSVLLMVLSCFIILLTLIFEQQKKHHQNSLVASKPLAILSILSGLINGVLSATNAIMFYMFFEAIVIPLYLVIGLWGGKNRVDAATKFFLYTFLGSLLFLIGIIYLYDIATNLDIQGIKIFDIKNLYLIKLNSTQQVYLFWAFFLAFAIKVALIPLHTWLPDAHYEAPTSCSVVLAAISLKLGVFAMLRFLAPLTVQANYLFSKYIILAVLIGMIYICLVAFAQKDLKKTIAYSSIAHMGLVIIGIFLIFHFIKHNASDWATYSLNGALIQIFAHSLNAAGLFFSAGILFDRFNSNKINDLFSIVTRMPGFTILFTVFCLGNIAMPGTFNFVGEFLIILASFKYSIILTTLMVTSLILSLFYTFAIYKQIIFDNTESDNSEAIHGKNLDLRFNEIIILGSLTIVIIFLGFKPALVVDLLNNFTLNFIKLLSNNCLT